MHVRGIQNIVVQVHADELAASGDLNPGALIEEGDAEIPIDGDHAVGRTLKDRRDPSRGFLGFFLRLGQFVLAVLQCIGHGVERVGDPGDFAPLPAIHTPGIIAEPPLVRGVDQVAKRAMNEPPGPQPCQDQYQRGADDDPEDSKPRAALHLGEGPRLVEAKADHKPSGILVQG